MGHKKSLPSKISSSMMHNAGVFLKKAAEEIVGHADDKDEPFSIDRATLVAVLIQTAVELASSAILLKNEGFSGVIRQKDMPTTEAEATRRWKAGTIRTLPFEEQKSKAATYLGDDYFWSIVDELQILRNKLVHFHIPMAKGDRFDLKYEVTHVLIQITSALVKTDEHEFAFGCWNFFGSELFHRLVSFPPYQERISERARKIDPKPLKCGSCNATAFLCEEETCLCCGYSGEIRLLDCLNCGEHSVFYDHLNLPINDMLKARCGRCDWEGEAIHCKDCGTDYLISKHNLWHCPCCDPD